MLHYNVPENRTWQNDSDSSKFYSLLAVKTSVILTSEAKWVY